MAATRRNLGTRAVATATSTSRSPVAGRRQRVKAGDSAPAKATRRKRPTPAQRVNRVRNKLKARGALTPGKRRS